MVRTLYKATYRILYLLKEKLILYLLPGILLTQEYLCHWLISFCGFW